MPAEILDLVRRGLAQDTSYRNDIAPSVGFDLDDDSLRLFVDHPDPTQREIEGPRFLVDRDGTTIAETDDVREAIQAYLDAQAHMVKHPQKRFHDEVPLQAALVTRLVRRAKDRILRAHYAKAIPSVRSFSALQDHADANTYLLTAGGDFEPALVALATVPHSHEGEIDMNVLNAYHNAAIGELDAWLRAGALADTRKAAAKKAKARRKKATASRTPAPATAVTWWRIETFANGKALDVVPRIRGDFDAALQRAHTLRATTAATGAVIYRVTKHGAVESKSIQQIV